MRRTANITLLLVLSLLFVCTATYASDAREEARAAALQWLAHLDAGEYDEAWNESAELFRSEVAIGDWQTAATNVRSPMGDLVARSFRSARQTATVPGFPQGDYVVIVFFSRFQGRPEAEETITMMNDGGEWRAVSYFVR